MIYDLRSNQMQTQMRSDPRLSSARTAQSSEFLLLLLGQVINGNGWSFSRFFGFGKIGEIVFLVGHV